MSEYRYLRIIATKLGVSAPESDEELFNAVTLGHMSRSISKVYTDYEKLEAERDALKEFKQGVYQYLRECQPSTKEEIELYESFSHFIRSLDN